MERDAAGLKCRIYKFSQEWAYNRCITHIFMRSGIPDNLKAGPQLLKPKTQYRDDVEVPIHFCCCPSVLDFCKSLFEKATRDWKYCQKKNNRGYTLGGKTELCWKESNSVSRAGSGKQDCPLPYAAFLFLLMDSIWHKNNIRNFVASKQVPLENKNLRLRNEAGLFLHDSESHEGNVRERFEAGLS